MCARDGERGKKKKKKRGAGETHTQREREREREKLQATTKVQARTRNLSKKGNETYRLVDVGEAHVEIQHIRREVVVAESRNFVFLLRKYGEYVQLENASRAKK